MALNTTQLSIRLPAVQGGYGPRLATFASQIKAGDIETMLGHDPRSAHWKFLPKDLQDIYPNLQRQTSRERVRSLMRYVRERFTSDPVIAGAFPAISIAMQNEPDFEPKADDKDLKGMGVLHLDVSKRNARLLVDGLGRATAAMTLAEEIDNPELSDEDRQEIRTVVEGFSLPVVFFAPALGTGSLTREEMQQLFHDFNFRVAPVPPRIAMALDHSDMYIGLTNRLGNGPLIRSLGGMEAKAASLGTKSTAVVVQQHLLRFVRGGAEGHGFVEAKNNSDIANPNLTQSKLGAFRSAMEDFLGGIVETMGEERFKTRGMLHTTSPGWGALGVAFHDAYVLHHGPAPHDAGRRIGALDWSRDGALWREIIGVKTKKGTDETMLGLTVGGAQARRYITRTIREQLGIDAVEEPKAA